MTTPPDGGTVQQARDKGQELVSQAQDNVQQKAQEVRGQAGDRLREQVDQRSTQAGEQAQSFAGSLRKTAENLRGEGKDSHARYAEQAAERVERAGSYLQQSDADRILSDAEDFARRKPWVVAGGAALVGFVASRFLKASSDRRYEGRRVGLTSYPTAPVVDAGYPVVDPVVEPVSVGSTPATRLDAEAY